MLGGLEHGVASLGLAADTLQSVNDAIAQGRTQEQPIRQQIRTAHDQMHSLLEQTPPALDAVLAQADSIGALETQARKIELQTLVSVRQLLTPDQWQQLRAQRGQWQQPPSQAPSQS